MKIVDEVDALARRIGAISCVVVRPDGSLAGTNNDCYGFARNILQQQPGWRADAGPAVVIGAGGGSRAVVYGLAQEGAREIRLVNRTRERARESRASSARRSMPLDGRIATRARRRRDGGEHDQPGHGRPAAARPQARRRCRRARSSPTSSTFRSRRRFSPPRGRAATGPSTASACCSTRRASPGGLVRTRSRGHTGTARRHRSDAARRTSNRRSSNADLRSRLIATICHA